MPRLPRAILTALTLTALLPATASAAATVDIVGKSFGPTAVNVAPGDAVTWNWNSGPHNVHVISGPQTFDSGIKDTGGTYTRTLTAAGTYTYQCDVHPSMRGTVVVGQAAAPGAPTKAAVDAAPPALRDVKVSRLAVVQFAAAQAGTLTIRVLRGNRVVRRSTAKIAAGLNHRPLAVRGLARGRYRVSLQATNAAGQRSAAVVRSLVVTRAVLARHVVMVPTVAPLAPVTPAAAPATAPAADDHHGAGHD
jgi:plastocyanin